MPHLPAFTSPIIFAHRTHAVQICPQRPILPGHRHRPLGRYQTRRNNASTVRMPPRAASATPSIVITEGTFVEVLSSSRRRLAKALRPDGKRNWFVEDATAQTSSVTPKQITFVIGHPSEYKDLDISLGTLNNLAASKAAECAELLETAWEIIASGEGIDGTATTTVSHTAKIIMDDTSRLAQLATHMVLTSDTLFFKEKVVKGVPLYDARTNAHVEEGRLLKQAEEMRKKKEENRLSFLYDAFKNRDLDAFRDVYGIGTDVFLHHMEEMALELDTSPNIDNRYDSTGNTVFQQLSNNEKTQIKDLFSVFNLPILPSSAFKFLVQLGVFEKHENLALRNVSFQTWAQMEAHTEAEVERFLNSNVGDVDADQRVDLTHLETFAIDSADTTEVDDAFSYDHENDMIYVHIADPSRYFPAGIDDAIVQHVLRRGFTLYLPSEKYTMFPESIATRVLSLDGDLSDGSALSFVFRIEEDGSFSDESMQVQVTKVRNPTRLTYEQADVIFTKKGADKLNVVDEIMRVMYDRMEKRRYWREMEGGAIMINTPISNVVVKNLESDKPDIEMNVIATDSPSWLTVSELMISSCTIGATLAMKFGLTVPFRGQEPFDYPEDDVLESVPDGPVRAALAFKQATPSMVTTTVMEHASLGLDAYVQVTSPIRRSLDLVAHMQFKAYLRKSESDMLSVEQVNQEISRVQTTSRLLRNVENRTTRYWQLEYFRRLDRSQVFRGLYIRAMKDDSKVGLVYLEEIAFTLTADIVSGVLGLGDEVDVEIVSVDVRASTIRAIARKRRGGGDGVEEVSEDELEAAKMKEFEEILSEISEISDN